MKAPDEEEMTPVMWIALAIFLIVSLSCLGLIIAGHYRECGTILLIPGQCGVRWY